MSRPFPQKRLLTLAEGGTMTCEAKLRECVEACEAATAYFQMLENATGVEHGVLNLLRQALRHAQEPT